MPGCVVGPVWVKVGRAGTEGALTIRKRCKKCPARSRTASFATVFSRSETRLVLPELRRASAVALPRCIVSRYATAWAESLEGAISGHQTWALLCRYRCRLLLAKVPEGTDRNVELKLLLRMWDEEQISELISKI